ncbi:condensin subunit Smc [Prosthecobacter fusiformis]|uniref:Chromosome partition protein Smc n=1 Tax=Prosthecobacter fusiformis TaxID=48464 RepID=A0A4R7S740_9BACT|nr:chromosome segregation protein SMC [Prosthecobacter fusiformis]TDU73285.1 condensin subunit Smc [Prosthecobacter fusiformis]
MYLKSLTLHGFKSFADKTHFEFHKGVTGIVGPNGCGKSNVVDAIRWVLGETSAKALRGEEMADVIFNGTDKRKPVGLAEVVLTMADCEQALGVAYNEVAICRRVFRDGRSEYRLNNTVCRLKDINDLFSGTGIGRQAYSIMAQGQIDMLLSSKPEDRRMVFEEAAGITKFKGQKKEALRKLEYTEANLLRVADVIAEVKRQMGTLQRQAAKARRYQTLLDDVRMFDTHLAHRQYSEYSAEKAESENHVRMMTEQLEQLQQRLQTTELEATETREAYHSVESQINQLRQQSQELRSQVQSAEGRIGFNNERNEELHGRIRQNEEQITQGQHHLEQQRQEMISADEQLISIRENIETRQISLNEHLSIHNAILPDRSRLDSDRRSVRESIRQFEGQIASADARAQSLTNQITADRQRYETLAHDRQVSAEAKETSQIEFDNLQKEIQDLEETRNELDEKAKYCAREIIEKRGQRDALNEELTELQRAVTQRRSRIEIIEQLLQKGEGLAEGTQQVLKGLDNPEVYSVGVRGLLASAIEVEPRFIAAIEAALRDHLQAVLLTDSELASQILDRLSNKMLGKAALLPHDFATMRAVPDRQLVPEGGIAWAIDKVKARQGVQELTDRLLNNVLIVDDLHTALRLKKQLRDVAIATLQGEFIAADGVIHGGATKEEAASMLRREAEVRTLKVELEGYEYQVLEKEDAVAQLRAQVEDMQREELTLREQSQRAREGFSQLTGKLSVVQRALQQASTKLESVEWDQNQITGRIQAAEAQIAWQREESTVAQEQLEGARIHEGELEIEMEAFLRRELESSERLNELRTALALEQSALQSLERQKAPMATRLHELEAAIQRFDLEINTWRSRIEQGMAENARFAEQVESQRGAIEAIDEHLQNKTEERAGAFERVTELENQLVQLRQQTSGLSDSRNRIEVQLTRVDLRLENLINQVQERYAFHISAFEPDYHALMYSISEQKKSRGRGGDKRKSSTTAFNEAVQEVTAQDTAEEQQNETEEADESSSAATDMPVVDADEVDLDAIEIPGEEGHPDWDFVSEVVGELRQKLESIGAVNLDAIQEFEELEERHNFLDTQHNDLVNSKEELLQVIARINETTKIMFSETFELVRGFFHNNFRELFGPTAKADLMLTDDTDPLESGIEIIAKPPGKKLQTISLLSGGERSMTAVALLFSIYQVKPSPFCVLDELDAPLDESNISRFLKMLDNFIDNSQFIIVTHNKRTMSRADVIYGVSMQEFGISKPIGVRMTTEDTRPPKQQELRLDAEVAAEESHHGDEPLEEAQEEPVLASLAGLAIKLPGAIQEALPLQDLTSFRSRS